MNLLKKTSKSNSKKAKPNLHLQRNREKVQEYLKQWEKKVAKKK